MGVLVKRGRKGGREGSRGRGRRSGTKGKFARQRGELVTERETAHNYKARDRNDWQGVGNFA